MTDRQFAALIARSRPNKGSEVAQEAVRRVLVDGVSQYRAAHDLGISEAAVSRMRRRLTAPVCKSCGQTIKG